MSVKKHFDHNGIVYAIDVSNRNHEIKVQVVDKDNHQPINSAISYGLSGVHYSDTAYEGAMPEVIKTLVETCESDFKKWDAYNSSEFQNYILS
ncbi:MAG: hypothetical protein ACTH5D_10980 [Halomonas sp.]|uniref:hypothetical protein n=1 Tax=Halomonas sp. TaxID=1486246 RepID=UPI003F8FA749